MPVRQVVMLLLIGAAGCGAKVQTSTSTPTKEVATTQPVTPKEVTTSKPVTSKGTPPNPPVPNDSPPPTVPKPVALGKSVPTKLYAAGLMATADAPPEVDVRGEASFQMHLRFRKDFVLYISPSKKTFADELAEAKKGEHKFIAQDSDGFVTQHPLSDLCVMCRHVKIDDVDYEMSCSSWAKADVLLAYAVARSVRQTPEDAAAVKATAKAWEKFANEDKYGIHPAGGYVLARSEDQPTDASFGALKEIAYLKKIDLNAGGTVTPAGLKAALGPNVFEFWASGDWFNDSFAKSLTGNKTLLSLNLDSKAFGDEGAKQLTGLTNVWYASFSTPKLTDEAALVFLPTMTKVEVLTLFCPKLTNAMLPALARLDRLEDLSLSSTAITDDAIEDLVKIPNLTFLKVRGTKMTAEGVKKLRAAKKGWYVYSDFDK